MLLAEIHGKYVQEARASEDYLTSTVFGHLRYIVPGPFWQAVFDLATSLPVNGESITASRFIETRSGRQLSLYEKLDAIFWPSHPQLGEPDLILHFSANDAPSVVVIVEAKLYSDKSGFGEHDQLSKYLHILGSLGRLRPSVPDEAIGLLVYLTAIDSQNDVLESLSVYGDTTDSRTRLYRLQWQDLVLATNRIVEPPSEAEGLILENVRAFLRKRDLEYFSGMVVPYELPRVSRWDGDLFVGGPLLGTDNIPDFAEKIQEGWVNGN
jgi:hypothetical protein